MACKNLKDYHMKGGQLAWLQMGSIGEVSERESMFASSAGINCSVVDIHQPGDSELSVLSQRLDDYFTGKMFREFLFQFES